MMEGDWALKMSLRHRFKRTTAPESHLTRGGGPLSESSETGRSGMAGLGVAVSRGLALFLGGFSLLNLLGELRYRGFDANLWWIDLRPLAPWLSRAVLAVTSLFLVAHGMNTQATVCNTCRMFDEHNLRRILAVSHFYHLPRVKLTYQRYGREVCTVPAQETYRLTALPVYMVREIVALWVYYVRPLAAV
jgi:hypothetical protein